MNDLALTRARRGAAFLDKKLGRGWRRKIKRRELSMRSSCSCIVGQIYGSYGYGMSKLGIEVFGPLPTKLGFFKGRGHGSKIPYAELDEAWLQILREKP